MDKPISIALICTYPHSSCVSGEACEHPWYCLGLKSNIICSALKQTPFSGTKAAIHKLFNISGGAKEDTKEILALFCVSTRAAMI